MCGILGWVREMQHLVEPGLLLGRERSFKAIKSRPDRIDALPNTAQLIFPLVKTAERCEVIFRMT